MSLNYDISKCNKDTLPNEVVIDAVIWLTMAIGMGEITDKNEAEFYARIHSLELLGGAFIIDDNKEPRFIQPSEIHALIGLETNVSTATASQFAKLLYRRLEDFRKDFKRGVMVGQSAKE